MAQLAEEALQASSNMKWWYLGLDANTDVFAIGALDGLLPPHLQPHTAVEFECIATRRDFWVAVDHSHLLPHAVLSQHIFK